MAEWAAQRRERVAALLKSLPEEASYRLAHAAGVFAALAPLIDLAETSPSGCGFVRASSLPAIWRWFSISVAPDAVGDAMEVLAASAVGEPTSRGAVVAAVRRARSEIGRAALAALAARSIDQVAGELGSRQTAEDAAIVARGFVVSEQIERLADAPRPADGAVSADMIAIAQDVARREPDCVAPFLCAVLAHCGRPAAVAPLALALARRRDESRLDLTGLGVALNFALEAACAHGRDELGPRPRAGRAAIEVVDRRARQVAELAAALRDHVTLGWMRRLNERVAETSRVFVELCGRCQEDVRTAVQNLEEPEAVDAADAAAAALAATSFLTASASAAVALHFDMERRRELAAVTFIFRETHVASIERGLIAVAARSSAEADTLVTRYAAVVRQLEGARAGRAWARRARRLIGRPNFEEQIFGSAGMVAAEPDAFPLRRGQVDQGLLDRVWDWAAKGVLASALGQAELQFEDWRYDAPDRAAAALDDFRALLLETMRNGLDAGSLVRDLQASPPEHDQLELVAELLACDAEIRAALEHWPPRLKHVGEEYVADVRALHDRVSETAPELEPALLLAVMERLDRPWQILRVLERIARTRSDTLIEATEFEAVGEVLIDRAEADARAFAAAERDGFHADPVIAALERFAGIASGMTEEFEIKRNGLWGRRLYALKARAARDLEALCQQAVSVIEVITPRRTVIGGKWSADVSRRLDEAQLADAAQRARFVRMSKILDHRAAFAGARSRALSIIEGRLDGQIEALLEAAQSEETRQAAIEHLNALAEVVCELRGEEAGQILQRRAAAA